MSEHAEHANVPYYKILGWLTFLTAAEIAWTFFGLNRAMLIAGLGVMALVKAALVFLYYMHMKYEARALWFVMAFPMVLIFVMVAGFLPDAVKYWD